MPTIYVLDVPEFRALAEVARTRPEYRVTQPGCGYLKIESDDDVVFHRKELGFKPAIWYGAFTGGVDGRIAEFGRDVVRIVADDGISAK
tara:strand:- start:6510 stop:6776 length:267 start_codon:yes stop_codon:yes gene_type:complete